MKIRCSHCNHEFEADADLSGNQITCPSCAKEMQMPTDANKPDIAQGKPPLSAPRAFFNESSAFFLMIMVYTPVYLGLLAVEFFTHGTRTAAPEMMPVYVTLLGMHAAERELRRWLAVGDGPRQESLFIYSWVLFFLTAYTLNRVRPEFTMPSDLPLVTLLVMVIFVGSRASEAILDWRSKNIFYTLP